MTCTPPPGPAAVLADLPSLRPPTSKRPAGGAALTPVPLPVRRPPLLLVAAQGNTHSRIPAFIGFVFGRLSFGFPTSDQRWRMVCGCVLCGVQPWARKAVGHASLVAERRRMPARVRAQQYLFVLCRLHQARGHPAPGHFSLAAAAEELWSAERALGALHTAAQWTHPAEKASAGAAHCRCPPLLLPPIAAARRRFCPYPLLCCLCRAAAILRWLPC